jgi:tetratricopeptide (TPR) repeat protein
MLQKNENNIMASEEILKKMEKEIEIPVCLNLGLAYLKVKDFSLSVKYCSQALEKDSENDKALYRRGMANLGSGFIEKARADLNKAFEVTNGKDQNVIKALHELKEKVAKNKIQEKELVKKMLLSGGLYEDQVKPASTNDSSE